MEAVGLGWVSLALINAALANIDHRGPLPYFFGSLIFGPFVTLLIASTREDEAGRLRQTDILTGRDVVRRVKQP